jgi:hypothetical protein
VFALQLLTSKVGGWTHFFVLSLLWIPSATCSRTPWEAEENVFVQPFMELSNKLLKGSMRSLTQDVLIWPPTFNVQSWRSSLKHFRSVFCRILEFLALELHNRPNKKIWLLSIQLSVPKIGGQAIKFSSNSYENKSFEAWSFQMCRNFFKFV